MKLKIRTYFEDDSHETFMGIGLLWLLEGIEKEGSIRRAAEEMNMSYTKAHQILRKLESTTGKTFLERHKGGNDRMGTTLTPYGKKYLDLYREFNRKVEDYCRSEFEQFRKEVEKESI